MEFDFTHDPANDPKLSPIVQQTMRQTRDHWRRMGLSVQFISERGTLDEWSFASAAARDAFIAKNLADKPHVVSA